MSFLLDTNIVSEQRRGKRTDPGVRAWLEAISVDALFLSVMTFGEIQQGVSLIQERDPPQALVYETWLDTLRRDYRDRTLLITTEIALTWGRLLARHNVAPVDGLLAATALVHDLTLVTRNVRDVARTGAKVLNPFEGT